MRGKWRITPPLLVVLTLWLVPRLRHLAAVAGGFHRFWYLNRRYDYGDDVWLPTLLLAIVLLIEAIRGAARLFFWYYRIPCDRKLDLELDLDRRLARRRARSRLCPACGYDVRASQFNCPECGWVIRWVCQAVPRRGKKALTIADC